MLELSKVKGIGPKTEMLLNKIGITNIDDLRDLSEKNTDNTIQTLFQLAKQYNLAIAGSFIAKTSNKIFNRAFLKNQFLC